MIFKKPELNEADDICSFLKKEGIEVNIATVNNLIKDNNSESLISIDKGISGVILAKKLPDILEINSWGLKRDDRSLFDELFQKSRSMGFKSAGVIENEKSKKRLETLTEIGFKEIRRLEGFFPDDNAVVMRRKL